MTDQTLDTNPDDTALTDAPNDAPVDKGEVKAEAEVKTDATPEAKPDTKADTKAETAPDWPEDWREKAAGGDAKVLARLSRFASPKAVADALIAAQNRISQGDLKPVLKKDATPEQLADYRKELGIPETPDKYDISAYKLEGDDAKMIEGYLAKAHATNQTPEQVKAGIDAYMEINTQINESRQNQDVQIQTATEDVLRGEWGNDYRRNITLVNSLLDGAPDGLKDRILTGRLSDGTPIGSDPDALRWLLGLELERNPVGVIAPSGGGNMAKTVDDEIKTIETMMRENRKAYDRDEKTQARYRDLLQYRLNEQKKAA